MAQPVSIKGPLEKIEGKLLLRIPLEVGGQTLIGCTKGIGHVDGDFLVIEILPWMIEQLGISEGDLLAVDNHTGEFRMQRAVDE